MSNGRHTYRGGLTSRSQRKDVKLGVRTVAVDTDRLRDLISTGGSAWYDEIHRELEANGQLRRTIGRVEYWRVGHETVHLDLDGDPAQTEAIRRAIRVFVEETKSMTAAMATEGWQEHAEKRLRDAGFRFAGTAQGGGKTFFKNGVRCTIPTRGVNDPGVEAGVNRDVSVAINQAAARRGVGMRPEDVEKMQPLGGDEPPAGALITDENDRLRRAAEQLGAKFVCPHDGCPYEGDTMDALQRHLATDHAKVAAAVTPPALEPTIVSGTKKAPTFQPCPVQGCQGRAVGKHLWQHINKGELPAGFKMPPPTGRPEAEPTAPAVERPRKAKDVTIGTAAKRLRERLAEMIDAIVERATDELEAAATAAKSQLEDLVVNVDDDRSKVTILERENAELREQLTKVEQSMSVILGLTKKR